MPFSTKIEINKRRSEVAKMYLMGMFQYQIAAKVGVTQGQVSQDLKELNKAWAAGALDDISEAKARELAKLDLIEAEAWDAWQRSKGKTVKRSAEKKGSKKTLEKLEETENVGDPRYLSQVENCIKGRCQLLGLTDTAITINNVNIQPKEWVSSK